MTIIPIPKALLAKAMRTSRDLLNKKSSHDSLRVQAGLALIRYIGYAANPRSQRLPDPSRNAEVRVVWQAIFEPLQRLAALAESKGIDSLPLLKAHEATNWDALASADQILQRLEIIECGPAKGKDLATMSVMQGVIARARADLHESNELAVTTRKLAEAITKAIARSGDSGDAASPQAVPIDVDAEDMKLLLFLNARPGLRHKVCDVNPAGGLRDRGVIGDRLRALAKKGYLDYPEGRRKGVIILPKGADLIKRLNPPGLTKPAQMPP